MQKHKCHRTGSWRRQKPAPVVPVEMDTMDSETIPDQTAYGGQHVQEQQIIMKMEYLDAPMITETGVDTDGEQPQGGVTQAVVLATPSQENQYFVDITPQEVKTDGQYEISGLNEVVDEAGNVIAVTTNDASDAAPNAIQWGQEIYVLQTN